MMYDQASWIDATGSSPIVFTFATDPFGSAGWLGFASFGLGLRLGPVGADVRRGDVGTSSAVPTAVSVVYQPS
jgi:hypothetical protein